MSQENLKAFDVDLKILVKPEEKWQPPELSSMKKKQNRVIDKSSLPKMKLAIDSEDDTSCSLITNPTLADQVLFIFDFN